MKILVSWSRLPTIESSYTIQIQNIVNALKTKTDVQLIWLICMPEKLENIPNIGLNSKIIDIHNYKNALEILEKEKPDIIFGSSSYNLISYSVSIAGKFLGIPVVSDFSKGLSSLNQSFTSPLSMFFENSISTDSSNTKKRFMKRGRFFLYKLFFVIRTQNSIKMNLFKNLKLCLILLRHHLSYEILPLDSRFANDLHWLSSESLIDPLIKAGFKKNTLVVTGDPLFDNQFKQICESKNMSHNKQIKILFAPSTFYEHGLCTKNQQDEAIKNIISTITKNKDFSLVIKIHPSSAIYSDYKKLVDSISPSIKINQSGNIVDFIDDSDLLIVFPTTTVCVFALAAKKPVIIYNFLNMKGDVFIENQVAYHFQNIDELSYVIENTLKNSIPQNKIHDFLTSFYYKTDGLASQRIANAIIELIEKNSNK